MEKMPYYPMIVMKNPFRQKPPHLQIIIPPTPSHLQLVNLITTTITTIPVTTTMRSLNSLQYSHNTPRTPQPARLRLLLQRVPAFQAFILMSMVLLRPLLYIAAISIITNLIIWPHKISSLIICLIGILIRA